MTTIKQIRLVFLIFMTGLILTGCYNTLLPIRIPTKKPKIPENSILKDIPRYENGDLFAYYRFTKQKQEQLGLSVPENGYDSLLIRFWYSYPENLNQYAELVELKIDSIGKTSADYIKMLNFFNPTRLYEKINRHFDTIVSPKCGWTVLIDSIHDLGITKLPTQEFLPEYIEINKGERDYGNTFMTVCVEVSTKNEYRFFQYNNFEKYKNIDEVNRLYRFLLFFREQMGLRENDKGWYGEKITTGNMQ